MGRSRFVMVIPRHTRSTPLGSPSHMSASVGRHWDQHVVLYKYR